MSSGVVTVTIKMSAEVVEVVRDLAAKRGVTFTEVVREAITTEKFLDDEMARGVRVLLQDGKTTRELRFKSEGTVSPRLRLI